tara:strand:+ start:4282 stop:4581 length:300 start_codon:yes stop_codon:yes gene_type:complete
MQHKPNQKASEALQKVDLLINGARAKSHGNAFETHTDIAELWSLLLKNKLKEPLDVHDVYRAMIGIKQIRNRQNPKVDDNMIDIIGYAALAIEAKDGKN